MNKFNKLYESITEKIDTNFNIDFSANEKGQFSTKLGKKAKGRFAPFVTKSKDLYGGVVYSAYSNNAIKGRDRSRLITPTYTMIKDNTDDSNVKALVNRAAALLSSYIRKNHDPDSILIIKSSSDLTEVFGAEIARRFPYISPVSSAVRKSDISKLKIVGNPDDEKREKLEKIISKMNKLGKYSSKKVHQSLRPYLGDFMELADDLEKQIKGKTIILVDDILTTRSTFIDSFRQIAVFNPKEIIGVTLFK